MPSDLSDRLDRLAPELSSISVSLWIDGAERYRHTTGVARLDPPLPAVDDQAYDLASVTKVLAGTSVTASLIEEGLLSLDTPVSDVLGALPTHADATRPILVRDLLQHGSGLPAWHPFYRDVYGPFGTRATREAVFAAVNATEPVAAPGERHIYSDVGFLQLLQVLETVTGQRIDTLFYERIAGPAGVTDLRYGWPFAAATEWPCPHRRVGVQGTVHDLNCASIGGASTHAGLFGTARAVGQLCSAFLAAARGERSGLPGATLRAFWGQQGPGSHRCGWDTISRGGYTSTGAHFPDDSLGHLGYTGTSVWMSPERRTVAVVLSNRVHPIDDTAAIRRIRPVIHDAIAEHLEWT